MYCITNKEKEEFKELIKIEVNKLIENQQEEIKKEVFNKIDLETKANALANRLLYKSNIKGLSKGIKKVMEEYLSDLNNIKEFKDNIKNEIAESVTQEIKGKTQEVIKDEKESITEAAHSAYELVNYIENAKERIVDDIVNKVTKRVELEDVRPRKIEIYNNNNKEKVLKNDLYHQEFENIYKLIRIGLPVMLIGPTGSGKSVCAGQVAEALNLKMYYTNNASEEYKLLGFTDAHGKYKETQFYKAFKEGGLFFLDEIDNSHPSALLSLNSAIGSTTNGNIYMAFEDGEYTKAHKDFRIIAAANTWGNGASRMYCGRSELDSASLDRFIQIYFDYDHKIEKSIINDDELLKYFWDFRRIINDLGIRHTVTTRNIDYASKLKEAGFTIEQILLYTVIKELDYEDMKIIYERFNAEGITPSIYSEEFKRQLLKKA